jgi:hypothetical protein
VEEMKQMVETLHGRSEKCHETLDEKQQEPLKPFGVGFQHFGISGLSISETPMTRSWGTLH